MEKHHLPIISLLILVIIAVLGMSMLAGNDEEEEYSSYSSQEEGAAAASSQPNEAEKEGWKPPDHPEGWYGIPVEFRNSCGEDEYDCLREWEEFSKEIAKDYEAIPKKWKEKCQKRDVDKRECLEWYHIKHKHHQHR